MGEETARLRREIDRTREDLTRDVDMIADKTSPSRIVERRVQRTREGLSGLRDRLMGRSDDRADGSYGDYGGYGVYDSYGTAGGATATMTDRATGAVQSAGESAHALQERASDAAHEGVRRARRQTEGNPLAAGVIAFGIGWLVSSLLPASEAETGAAQRTQEKAREHGGPVLEQAKQAAAEIGENLRGSAQEAVEQVKGHVQEGTRTIKDEGASAAQTVKELKD